MKRKSPDRSQSSFLQMDFEQMLDPKQPLFRLAKAIPWEHFETAFADYYDPKGRKAKPIRLMVGLLILKYVEDLSDEVLIERWCRDPYYQYFCGMEHFVWEVPCHPTELIKFRQRIGETGCEEILKVSILMQPKKDRRADAVIMDTTVQEKNISYPCDSKLYIKVIRACQRIAKREGIQLRRTYEKDIRTYRHQLKTRNFPKAKKKARKATKKLQTLAAKILRDLQRKCNSAQLLAYTRIFETMWKIVTQERGGPDHVYSLHEPDAYCVGKGKDRGMYEFGTKAHIVISFEGVILAANNMARNTYDGHAVEDTCEQVERLNDQRVRLVIGDQGYRGADVGNKTHVITPALLKQRSLVPEHRSWLKEMFRRRVRVEPVIGHLKSDHRLCRNYLAGWFGDEINVLLAAAAWNFKRLMRLLALLRRLLYWIPATTRSDKASYGRSRTGAIVTWPEVALARA